MIKIIFKKKTIPEYKHGSLSTINWSSTWWISAQYRNRPKAQIIIEWTGPCLFRFSRVGPVRSSRPVVFVVSLIDRRDKQAVSCRGRSALSSYISALWSDQISLILLLNRHLCQVSCTSGDVVDVQWRRNRPVLRFPRRCRGPRLLL